MNKGLTPWEAPVIVLGIAERAQYVREGLTNIQKWNVLGLRQVFLAHFFPQSLGGLYIAIAIRTVDPIPPIRIRLVGEDDVEMGTLTLSGSISASSPNAAERLVGEPVLLMPPDGWMTVFVSLKTEAPITLTRAGDYRFVAPGPDGKEVVVGRLQAAILAPPALTPERIAAIRSDPSAVKAVRAVLQCRKCPTRLVAFAALDRDAMNSERDAVWYSELPDSLSCECGVTTFDLRTMRQNLHGVLGHSMPGDEQRLGYSRLYEKSALRNILNDFNVLLNHNPREELLQQFLQEHPVLLQQFAAERLFFKPSILTFFKADFAILTPQRELLLVEIERAGTKLLRRDGDEAADLHHAFDQVHRWLQVVSEHRAAVLDTLGLDSKSVSSVRGVVIAGRDKGYDAQQLRRAKGVDRGQVRFYTFDDLAFSLGALIRSIDSL